MKISSSDSLLLQRYLDRELSVEATDALRRRLAAEPGLQAALAEQSAIGASFGAAREDSRQPALRAPAGFAAAVLGEVRQLPTRAEAIAAEAVATGVVVRRVCRAVLLAAAVLFGIGLVLQAGLFDDGLDEQMQAAPEDVQAEMQRLDELIKVRLQAGPAGTGGAPVTDRR